MKRDLPSAATIAAYARRPAATPVVEPFSERAQVMIPRTWYAAILGHMKRGELVSMSAAMRDVIHRGLASAGCDPEPTYQPEIRGTGGFALNPRASRTEALRSEIRRRWADGETLTSIARSLNISVSYASNLKDGQ
jgi:hypothetical protein